MLEVAGPGRDTDFAPVLPHRARALEGEARTKRYAIGQNPPPRQGPRHRDDILDSLGRDCRDKHVQISPPLANKFAFAEACRGLGMIVSHTPKFIFLKTKKTAGTSVELALSELCGPDDVITPLTEIDEAQRAGKRGAQNWRLHGWWGSPRPLWKRRWLKFSAEDYGFYNHMPAAEARALLTADRAWWSYFKFAFDRNPWDRQVSWYHHRYRRKDTPPPFAEFMHSDRRARQQLRHLFDRRRARGRFRWALRESRRGPEARARSGRAQARHRPPPRQDHLPAELSALPRLL